jgi:hypothetical protein
MAQTLRRARHQNHLVLIPALAPEHHGIAVGSCFEAEVFVETPPHVRLRNGEGEVLE